MIRGKIKYPCSLLRMDTQDTYNDKFPSTQTTAFTCAQFDKMQKSNNVFKKFS